MDNKKYINLLLSYECGEHMDDDRFLELFSYIVKNDLIHSLQGHYGRVAQRLIDAGFLSENGDILVQA